MPAIGSSADYIEKFSVPLLNCLTINEFNTEDSFSFDKKIVQQDSSLYMDSPDVDSLFTNIIPLEEGTITSGTELIYNKNNIVECLKI